MTSTTSTVAHASLARRGAIAIALGLALAMLLPLIVATNAADARTTQTSAERRIAAAVTALLNSERRAHHLRALQANADLVSSARSHDFAMARRNTMSHQVRGESALGRRMDRAGYHWTCNGENIAFSSRATTAGVLALQRAMYNERAPYDSHRVNILSSHFRHVGVDVYVDRTHHKIWLTEDFGNN